MALLDLLNREVIAERFYTLPQTLQDALENADNRRAIQIALISNGVGDPDELEAGESIIAAVMLGLTHIDELKETLVENLGIKIEDAEKIATEVRTNVLDPLRSEIEKIYAPIGGGGVMPKPVLPVAMPMAPAPLPANPAPAATSSTAAPIPAPMPPISSWQPTRLAVPKPLGATDSAPNQKIFAPAAPMPFILQQDSSATPLAVGADFKLKVPVDIFKSSTPAMPVEVPRPPKTAELEIGKAPLPPKPQENVAFRATPAAASHVIHYTDLKTVISPGMPAAPQVPRPAAAAPFTPLAPIPPAPPKPTASVIPTPSPVAVPTTSTTPPSPVPSANPSNATPQPLKPPKVVNFGPEEVK